MYRTQRREENELLQTMPRYFKRQLLFLRHKTTLLQLHEFTKSEKHDIDCREERILTGLYKLKTLGRKRLEAIFRQRKNKMIIVYFYVLIHKIASTTVGQSLWYLWWTTWQ